MDGARCSCWRSLTCSPSTAFPRRSSSSARPTPPPTSKRRSPHQSAPTLTTALRRPLLIRRRPRPTDTIARCARNTPAVADARPPRSSPPASRPRLIRNRAAAARGRRAPRPSTPEPKLNLPARLSAPRGFVARVERDFVLLRTARRRRHRRVEDRQIRDGCSRPGRRHGPHALRRHDGEVLNRCTPLGRAAGRVRARLLRRRARSRRLLSANRRRRLAAPAPDYDRRGSSVPPFNRRASSAPARDRRPAHGIRARA